MPAPWLILSLLLTICFSCAAVLDQWRQNWAGTGIRSQNSLAMLMGDSRQMFANHFFVKADIYFHSGYYPTIFDQAKPRERLHIEDSEKHDEHADEKHAEEEEEADFLGKPRDWIERFGRNFFPVEHSHLKPGTEGELLPWLKLAAELDPQKVQTYTVGAFWLRTKLNKVNEAEKFLREGLRANPDSFEILLELGNIQNEHYHDPLHARNLWEIALKKYKQQVQAGMEPDDLILEQIIARLGNLEEEQGNFAQAIKYLLQLKEISPAKAQIEKRINSLREKIH